MISPEYGKIPEVLIGDPAKEVVKKILRRNPQIPFLTLRIHPLVPSDPKETCLREHYGLDEAEEIEVYRDIVLSDFDLEFWIVELGVFDEWTEYDELFIEKLTASRGNVHRYEEDWPLAEFFTISSKIELPEPYHIPMLDFKCRKTGDNLKIVLNNLRGQDQKGFILDSGNSFHFWGTNLLFEPGLFSEFTWSEFLLRNREDPFVDEKFIDVSLKRGYTCLRITKTAGERGKPVPRVIAAL